MYPASTTKIMTLALALEKAQGQLDTELTVSYDAVHSLYKTGSSHIALQEGEVVRLEDMLYAAEIVSANDSANVLAEYIGGTIEGGVQAMNQKAAELGLTGTHYANPHGLQDDAHYTTARDMALLTRWALQQPGFQEVFCRTETWTMQPTNKQQQERPFSIKDWLRLGGSKKYYRAYVKGSKTGFTNEAANTMVAYAEQDGIRLICVVLKSPRKYDKFTDVGTLLDYCYENFSRVSYQDNTSLAVPVAGGGGTLGEMHVAPAAGTVLLYNGLTAADIQVQYELPAQYVLGSAFAPAASLTLPDTVNAQCRQLGTVQLGYSGLAELLEENTYVASSPFGAAPAPAQKNLGALPAALAVLAVVLLAGAAWWLAAARRAKKRAAARRTLQASRRPAPAVRPPYSTAQRPRPGYSATPRSPRK